jgi:hypothetical protein
MGACQLRSECWTEVAICPVGVRNCATWGPYTGMSTLRKDQTGPDERIRCEEATGHGGYGRLAIPRERYRAALAVLGELRLESSHECGPTWGRRVGPSAYHAARKGQ